MWTLTLCLAHNLTHKIGKTSFFSERLLIFECNVCICEIRQCSFCYAHTSCSQSSICSQHHRRESFRSKKQVNIWFWQFYGFTFVFIDTVKAANNENKNLEPCFFGWSCCFNTFYLTIYGQYIRLCPYCLRTNATKHVCVCAYIHFVL